METHIAKKFTKNWICSWNKHDLEEILSHYSEEIIFHSPFISLLKFNDAGIITNKTDLKKYFEIGLKNYPDLHFQFHNFFVGINTVVIYYTSVNGHLAAEVFELNELGKAVKVFCNYGI